MNKKWLSIFLLGVLICGVWTRLSAQRAVTLHVNAATDASIQITWQRKSLVPLPGLQIFPEYQIHKSRDLGNWGPLGDRVRGAVGEDGKAISFTDGTTTGDQAFYRVESMVELSNTELIGEKLPTLISRAGICLAQTSLTRIWRR